MNAFDLARDLLTALEVRDSTRIKPAQRTAIFREMLRAVPSPLIAPPQGYADTRQALVDLLTAEVEAADDNKDIDADGRTAHTAQEAGKDGDVPQPRKNRRK